MKSNGRTASFGPALPRALALWLLGAIMLWLAEMLFILIALPGTWSFQVLYGSRGWAAAALKAIGPDRAAGALLWYLAAALLGGTVSAAAAVLRKGTSVQSTALFSALFLALFLFLTAGFWLNTRYLPELLSAKSLLANGLFLLICAGLGLLYYRRAATFQDESRPVRLHLCSAAALAVFVFGQAFIGRSLPLLSVKGLALRLAVTLASAGIWFALRLVPLARRGALERRVLALAAILLAGAGIPLLIKSEVLAGLFQGRDAVRDRPNVVLLVMDTARADRFSCYGYARQTTPRIDRIAAEGALFQNAVSPSNWTLPSHASIFTGLTALEHGAGYVYSFLDARYQTLAEALQAEGYSTWGYSNNPWVSVFTGLDQGFARFEEGWRRGSEQYLYELYHFRIRKILEGDDPAWRSDDQGAALTNRIVSRWIARKRHSPFFLFINYLEPHLPYAPPAPYHRIHLPPDVGAGEIERFTPDLRNIKDRLMERSRGQREKAVIDALYDGEMSYLDSAVGELYAALVGLGLHDETVFIITSDHGENLGDHGLIGHVYGLYDTLLKVNLIIRYPPAFPAGSRAEGFVQTTDIFHTILDMAGIEPGPSSAGPGKSLARRMEEDDFSEMIVASHSRPLPHLSTAAARGIAADHLDRDLAAVIKGGYKYILASDGGEELYDLERDPAELHNLASTSPQIAGPLRTALRGVLESARTSAPQGRRPRMDQETRDKLKSLGYIQ